MSLPIQNIPFTASALQPKRAVSIPVSNLKRGLNPTGLYFKGNGSSEVPVIIPEKPKGLKARFVAWVRSALKWLNPSYVMKRIIGY
jgi:hypothetical protein